MGPRAGQKLFTLQTVPPRLQGLEGKPNGAARAGDSHCMPAWALRRISARSSKRLCRYVSRPPVASKVPMHYGPEELAEDLQFGGGGQ
ncbi:MAG: hypothetical protein M3N91_16895 [Pseudomonadota bacterium]|nr:hypothetical protein [Pseudomonadota bacterium]